MGELEQNTSVVQYFHLLYPTVLEEAEQQSKGLISLSTNFIFTNTQRFKTNKMPRQILHVYKALTKPLWLLLFHQSTVCGYFDMQLK